MIKRDHGAKCISCGTGIVGREGQQFCNTKCLYKYNDTIRLIRRVFINDIKRAMAKNRIILSKLLKKKTYTKIDRQLLVSTGFDFVYSTHTHTTKSGVTYRFYFDYGYTDLGDGYLIVVKKKFDIPEEMKGSLLKSLIQKEK
jgi:hypothetical protein